MQPAGAPGDRYRVLRDRVRKLVDGQENPECTVRPGARWAVFKIRQLTDVFHCNLQHHLS
jgi:hypothetical protein